MPLTLASSSAMPWSGWFNRDLIENMPVGVYVCDADGVLVAYNRRAATLWGKTPTLGDTQQKFCGAHRMHLSDGTFIPHNQTPMAMVLTTHQPVAFEAMVGRPDGSLRNVSANVAPLFNDDQVFIGFVNCVLDITDSKRAAETRDRMWNLSQDLMFSAYPDGLVTAVNPACRTVLGWEEVEIVGNRMDAFIHPDDAVAFRSQLRALGPERKMTGYESRCMGKDGQNRWLSWNAVSDGVLIHAVGRDVTVQKAQADALAVTQDALRQSQKMEAIGQLTGGVAHDFNNLLHVIRGSADLLKMPGMSDERRSRFITAIANAADLGAKLTAQLLAFARRQSLKPEVFDVGAGIVAIKDMLSTLTGSRIKMAISVPQDACLVDADPSQLDTAIVNMVVNARDAMQGEGQLGIAVSRVALIPKIRAHPEKLGDFIAITISDNGAGIPPEHVERIFEPFFTTKGLGQGTGLGLSQVFGFAKQSDGEIMMASVVGSGTTFTLFLPRFAGASAGKPEPAPRSAPLDNADTRVLLVEDNVEVGQFALEMLRELGYQVTLAFNGHSALAEIDAASGAYDVVFSDVDMPGMSGIELASRIRALYANLPVVLTSGYSHNLGGVAGVENVLLQKPYTVEQLDAALQEQLRIKSPAPWSLLD
jgi:PAS domain S-box-containing protein